MIKPRFFIRLAVLLAAVWMLSGASCYEMPEPEPEPEPITGVWFDLFVSVDRHIGMNPTATLVRSVASLDADQPVIEFTGKAIDITDRYTPELIARGEYYYQVPLEDSNRFVKFHIEHNEAGEEYLLSKVDEQIPFRENVFYPGRYTYAWSEHDNADLPHLFMLGVDTETQEYYVTKRRGDNLAIAREERYKFNLPAGYGVADPGLITVRPNNNNKIFYFFCARDSSGINRPVLHLADLLSVTFRIMSDKVVPERVMEELVSDDCGRPLGSCMAYDETGTLYVAGLANEYGRQVGVLRRMQPSQYMGQGQHSFDGGWNGFQNPEGKLLTIQYVGNDKMLLYAREDRLGTDIDSRSHFYSILDLKTNQRTRLSCNGVPLPYCTGGLSQRSAVLDGKAYIGVTGGDGPDDYPMVYIYDSETDSVVPGVRLEKGYHFDYIRAMPYEVIPVTDETED
ncbi:MAG: hypothetical protein IJK19_02015 [Bacteroidales bacterium]|nr:hypothetical protein [Bacteroidales bacterium]